MPPPAKTIEVKLNGHTFTLPPGFEIEVVAGPPLVDRPIVADFDEQGRLYVADSSGSNAPLAQQVKNPTHRIVRLEDTDGDGRFDKATVFADKMMFPEGAMWHDGSLYVSAPPSIWKLTDTDGDGVADQRSEWFKGKTLTGCGNDLHGPYAGPDGWIYWCKGAFAEQTYERPGRKPLVTKASHIFRCRPDGSGIEPVMTGGMDNPVELVFTPGGERIFTTTFFQHPGGGQRDGLIHAIYGGIYGKDHAVIYDHPWTSPHLMPVLTHLGPAAPAGLTRYESRLFGSDYQDNLFAALFNLRKVTRHVLEAEGATFKSGDSDFLVSDNRDFHPTDVLEDADGSLLVVDTGGWYKLCCPTSQLVKPDVLGAIYRIRRKGAPRLADPRGLKLAWSKMTAGELARLLDDPRPAVRRRAVAVLGSKGAEGVTAILSVLRKGRSAEARCNAVWAVTRIDGADAQAVVRHALADADETVRQAAIHSISLRRDGEAVPALLGLLKGNSAHNARAAAEALGRIGDHSVVPALLDAAAKPADRALEHSLTFALIEIADAKGTARGLASKEALIRRAALVALDQMDGGGLAPQALARELVAPQAALKETASWIVGRHPEWGGTLAGFLRHRLGMKDFPATEREELVGLLARFARAKPVQELLDERLRDVTAPQQTRQTVLKAMARSGLKEVPAGWVSGLTKVLAGGDAELVREAVATVRVLPLGKPQASELTTKLLAVAAKGKAEASVRLGALAAVPGGVADVGSAQFDFLRDKVKADQPGATRSLAADVLSKARLTREQLVTLAGSLKSVGPIELDRLVDAFAKSSDERVGQALVAALKTSPALVSLRVETLKPRLAKFGAAVGRQAEELYAALDVGAAEQRSQLEKMLGSLKGGDVRRGQAVFNSQKTACVSCHAIGYVGGKIGPDLTRIGQIRTERDLLESVLFPSASLVRSYEPVSVTTKSGKVYNGLVRIESADEVVLTLGADQEVRISRRNIEEMGPSKVSIMPTGLEKLLTPQELADLVAFLKACR
ncbi:MAG: HEAT repeat domain-containing protein [Planctomycetes bacterium]|nr:HEAT repeat domain-containing protein [Planctomycetota bacterium]